jgi:hypothetical protein
MKKSEAKYVVLEHLTLPDRGFRFWTNNTKNNTHLFDGTLAYKEILFTDDENVAIHASQQINTENIATFSELIEWHKTKNK